MSESMSRPWIRDYLVGVAETYGAHLYNAPISKGKKRIQLTDFLTYQENSYIWTWVSDKDYKVPARISKDAVDEYKSKHGRSITDCRFFLLFIACYRPMFSPHPLGPNVPGNTSISHISLEIGQVSLIGTGGHLFGSPRDMELDDMIKEWVSGLRQDGGGGNVLKLRKQLSQARNNNTSQSPPPFSLYASTPDCRSSKTAGDSVTPKPERPQSLTHVYAKRWRKIEVDPWKLATKPATAEQHDPSTMNGPLVEPHSDSDTASRLRSRGRAPTSPHRTPPPSSLHRQGTPIDWSPSNRGSPAPNTITPGNGILQQDGLDPLPTTPHLPSEEHATADTDIYSLQPPTPAQRIKRSPLPCSSPAPCSPEVSARSPIPSFQQFPHPSPPQPGSSLLTPSFSSQTSIGIRKNIKRKVPHPGPSVPRPDPASQGPVQILVPNSDTSGTGSSQPYSQSQRLSQSQRQSQPVNPPVFPSCLAKELKPPNNEFVPREEKLGKQEGSDLTPALKVETSDTEETEELQLTHSVAQMDSRPNTRTKTEDSKQGTEDSQLSNDDADIHSILRDTRLRQSLHRAVASVMPHSTAAKQDTNDALIHPSTRTPERTGSRSSLHSIFSVSAEDNPVGSPQAPVVPIDQKEDKVQEQPSPACIPKHDADAWKEPSFIVKRKEKGKGRAVAVEDMPKVKVNKKRERSNGAESPDVTKRTKISPPEVPRTTPGESTGVMHKSRHQVTEGSTREETRRSSTTSTDVPKTTTPPVTFQPSKPRLAKFVFDLGKIDRGKTATIPRSEDIQSALLRTGRIRQLGEKVEKDGSVYIYT